MEIDMAPDDFAQLYGNKEFRHRKELLEAIATGNCSLNQREEIVRFLPSKHYFGIYSGRVRHLQRFTTPHATSLREDCEAFCKEIEATPDDPIRLWRLISSSVTFLIFENTVTMKIVGCLRTVSQLNVSEAEWEKLWGTGGTDPSTSSG